MDINLLAWFRFVLVISIVAWSLVGVAVMHMMSHHGKLRQWRGAKRPLGITHYDRHARSRTEEASYRGPLRIPIMDRWKFFEGLQRRIGEGDPDMREVSTADKTKEGIVVEREPETIPDIDKALGMSYTSVHCTSKKGGFVQPVAHCDACKKHSCNASRLVFFRGYPLQRGSVYARRTAFMDTRRLLCIACGFLLFLIHFTLCFNELSLRARRKFQIEYVEKRKAWADKENIDINNATPLLPTECAYYDFSAIPIAYYGKSDLNAGVLLT